MTKVLVVGAVSIVIIFLLINAIVFLAPFAAAFLVIWGLYRYFKNMPIDAQPKHSEEIPGS